MVLERHHSNRICFMPLALDTPKLWERFSLGFESLGLLFRENILKKIIYGDKYAAEFF